MKKFEKNIYALMTVIALIIGGINMPGAVKTTGANDIVVGTDEFKVCYRAENPVMIEEVYIIDEGVDAETDVNVYDRWPGDSVMEAVNWEAQGAVQTDYIPAVRPMGIIEANGLAYDTYVVSALALPGREDGAISFSGSGDGGDYFVLVATADVGEASVKVTQRRSFTYTVEDAEKVLSAVTPATSRTLTTETRRKAGVPIECDGRSVIIKGDFPEYPYTMISDTTLQVTGEDPAYDISYFITYFEDGEDFDLYADGEITDRWETTYDGRTVTVLEEEYEGTSTMDVFVHLDGIYYLAVRQNVGEVTDFSEDDVRALLSHVEF